MKSILDEVQGVGPAQKRALLRKFGSVKGMRDATEAELAGVAGGWAGPRRTHQAGDRMTVEADLNDPHIGLQNVEFALTFR